MPLQFYGAMLSQSQGDDGISNRFPVMYASRLLSIAERNYGITDLEDMVVSWAISHFETYIHGINFTIIMIFLLNQILKNKIKNLIIKMA